MKRTTIVLPDVSFIQPTTVKNTKNKISLLIIIFFIKQQNQKIDNLVFIHSLISLVDIF